MSLSESDKAQVRATWGQMSSQAEEIVAEAMRRMFAEDPASRTDFPADFDFSPGSEDIRAQSKRMVEMLSDAVAHLDNLDAQELRAGPVKPVNFQLLAPRLLEVMVFNLGIMFSPEVSASWNRFLAAVAKVFEESVE